jgi:uncharacterized protein
MVTVDECSDSGLIRIPEFDWEYGTATQRRFSIKPDDPLSAAAEITWQKEYGRGDFRIRIETRTYMRVEKENLRLTATLDAYEGEARAFSREWHVAIPRDHL